MTNDLEISVFGELSVLSFGASVPLPASRKARALLAFLVITARPHRRERLCEMLWDMPDDPKAALRWSLSKLRRVVDSPARARIVADRERVFFDGEGVKVDHREIRSALRSADAILPVNVLEGMAERLDQVFLDGLDGAGDEVFDAWLAAEREDARLVRVDVLRRLAGHCDMSPLAVRKWQRLWSEADPEGAGADGMDRAYGMDGADRVDRATDRPGDAARRGPAPGPTLTGTRAVVLRMRALHDQKIGYCTVPDGTKIAYATVGSGPPLLKAANWLSHLELDWSSPIWGRGFAEIARHRTFIRYDERGCGLSDWDVANLGFEAFVEDLEIVADKLGLDRFPLLGISQGAAVSIEYAVRHPERVTGLILLGGYAAGWRHLASPEEQARREAVMTLTELGWGTDNPAYRHIFSQTFMPDATAEDLAWFDEFQRHTTSPSNAARFQEAFGRIDVRHRLGDVRAPTIVLHSRHDQRIPFELGRAIAAEIPDARLVPLDSSNHVLLESEPAWQDGVDAVARFMGERAI